MISGTEPCNIPTASGKFRRNRACNSSSVWAALRRARYSVGCNGTWVRAASRAQARSSGWAAFKFDFFLQSSEQRNGFPHEIWEWYFVAPISVLLHFRCDLACVQLSMSGS